MDCLVGVVLERLVGDVGEDRGLVEHGSGQRVCGASVEPPLPVGRLLNGGDEPRGAHVNRVGDALRDHAHHDAVVDKAHERVHLACGAGTACSTGTHGHEPQL